MKVAAFEVDVAGQPPDEWNAVPECQTHSEQDEDYPHQNDCFAELFHNLRLFCGILAFEMDKIKVTSVDGLLNKPRGARALYVLAHGAGAGMHHRFLEEVSDGLAQRKIATFRYEFPYMAAKRRRPDPPRILQETVRSAIDTARRSAPDLPLVAGGKSMGGRMTSLAAADEPLDGVEGIAFLGFPLHAPGRVGDGRAGHLSDVEVPMLFIQGTRDSLADLDHIKGVCKRLGKRATLHIVEDGDHSFKVLKRSGRDPQMVMTEIVDTFGAWIEKILRR